MHQKRTDEILQESETEPTLDKIFLGRLDSIHEPNTTKQMAIAG